MKLLTALLLGVLFGAGITLSGMINPAKVLNFFDVAGQWDPSLLLVMGGALVTTAIGYRLVFGIRSAPVFDRQFALPTKREIDGRLIGGSALFGLGWGLAGFCPGGAIPALGLGNGSSITFVLAMIAGVVGARWFGTRPARLATSP